MSRIVTTTTAADGRSRLQSAEVAEPRGMEWFRELLTGPIAVPAVGRRGEWRAVSPGPGSLIVRLYEFAPLQTHALHHTDTLDLDIVLSGSVMLGVDEDEVWLERGDVALVRGDAHSWSSGPEGCLMVFGMLGAASEA